MCLEWEEEERTNNKENEKGCTSVRARWHKENFCVKERETVLIKIYPLVSFLLALSRMKFTSNNPRVLNYFT